MKKILLIPILTLISFTIFAQKIEKCEFFIENQIKITFSEKFAFDNTLNYVWIDDGEKLIYFEDITPVNNNSVLVKFSEPFENIEGKFYLNYYSTENGLMKTKI